MSVEEEVVDGEIVEESGLAVVPYTGEALVLSDLTDEQLAQVLDEAREFEYDRLRGFKREVQAEVLARMDKAAAAGQSGAWTLRSGEWKLEGDSPGRSDYDVDELRGVLGDLVHAELIAEDAIDGVIVPSGWKVAKRPLAQLLKLGGVVRDAIESCEHPSTKPRGVRVSRVVK